MKVRQVCHIALRRDHEFINTVQEGTEETHSQVIAYDLVLITNKLLICSICEALHVHMHFPACNAFSLSLLLEFLDDFRSARCI